jgi:hypothetical protein
MKRIYRAVCALLAWLTLIAQYTLMVQSGEFGGLGGTTLTYLGYFTILTNILAALAVTAPFFSSRSKLRAFFERQAVRAVIALYILVVMVVYWALLAKIHHTEGLGILTNWSLHLIIPVLYILDWLIFSPKGQIRFKDLPYWIVFPVAYGMFNILRGAITGFYPYPFLSISDLGFGTVFVNMLGFTSIYLMGGAAFIWLGRVLSEREA